MWSAHPNHNNYENEKIYRYFIKAGGFNTETEVDMKEFLNRINSSG